MECFRAFGVQSAGVPSGMLVDGRGEVLEHLLASSFLVLLFHVKVLPSVHQQEEQLDENGSKHATTFPA